jgi:hypothetical protein
MVTSLTKDGGEQQDTVTKALEVLAAAAAVGAGTDGAGREQTAQGWML